MADVANASVIFPRGPGSNLDVDKTFCDSVCVGFEFQFEWR
jgi:hypothetical protein